MNPCKRNGKCPAKAEHPMTPPVIGDGSIRQPRTHIKSDNTCDIGGEKRRQHRPSTINPRTCSTPSTMDWRGMSAHAFQSIQAQSSAFNLVSHLSSSTIIGRRPLSCGCRLWLMARLPVAPPPTIRRVPTSSSSSLPVVVANDALILPIHFHCRLRLVTAASH